MRAIDVLHEVKDLYPRGYDSHIQNLIMNLKNQFGEEQLPIEEVTLVQLAARAKHNSRKER